MGRSYDADPIIRNTARFSRANARTRMVVRRQKMMCVWCGSKGGFVNQLIIHRVGMDASIVECEWCSLKIDINLMKEVIE